MLPIPQYYLARFNKALLQSEVPVSFHVHYRKWLRYFLDFCRKYPIDIVVNLLYGCGLRLFECLRLRIQNFNFEEGVLTVHGKGDKDRTVPLPKTIIPVSYTHLRAHET